MSIDIDSTRLWPFRSDPPQNRQGLLDAYRNQMNSGGNLDIKKLRSILCPYKSKPYRAAVLLAVFIEGGAILRIAKETTSSHFYVELKPESTVSVTFEVVKEPQQANTIEIFCGLPEHEEKLVLNLAGQ